MAEDVSSDSVRDLPDTLDQLSLRTRDLQVGANGFARAMTSAFTTSVSGGKQFDDVLKSLALRLSDLSLKMALAPVTRGIAGGITQLFQGLFGAGGTGTGTGTGSGRLGPAVGPARRGSRGADLVTPVVHGDSTRDIPGGWGLSVARALMEA